MGVSAGEVRAALDAAYPREWAASWDAVGRVSGADDLEIETVLLAVDPPKLVIDEAVDRGAGMVVVHHPLHLHAVHGLKPGGVLEQCAKAGIALDVVHTNGDVARPGTSDTLWSAIGLDGDPDAIEPGPPDVLDLMHVYVPQADRDRLIAALAAAGAGRIGDYEDCAYVTSGHGQFRPGLEANPATGEVGELERVSEDRVEMVASPALRDMLTGVLRSTHPYEEPAFGFSSISQPNRRGFGRVGDVTELSFGDLVSKVSAGLNLSEGQLRHAGLLGTERVGRVAVAAGAGDDAIEAAAAHGAQVLVTSDLRHHRSRDALDLGLALIDVPHWSAEWPWLAELSRVISEATTVETVISTICTAPFR